MASQSKKTSDLPTSNTIARTDKLVIVTDPTGTPATQTITTDNFKKFFVEPLTPNGNTAPSSIGKIYFDTNFLYIAVSNTVIKKVALVAL